jgi:multisubunit Na+/H+ antiporter MnhG subunit
VTVVREVAVVILVAVSAILTALSSVGVLAMRDPYQRLHYIAPPAISAFLLVAALALDDAGAEACIKGLLVAVLLNVSNGILTHATARAAFVHQRGKWPPDPGEATPVEGGEGGS